MDVLVERSLQTRRVVQQPRQLRARIDVDATRVVDARRALVQDAVVIVYLGAQNFGDDVSRLARTQHAARRHGFPLDLDLAVVVLLQPVGHLLEALAGLLRLVLTQLGEAVVVGLELVLAVADEEHVARDLRLVVISRGDRSLERLLAVGADDGATIPVVFPAATPEFEL